jgi:putative phosphoesterase
VLEELREFAPVEAVHGNMDEPALKAELPERRVVEAEGLHIALVHDPGPSTGRPERLREWFPTCGFIAYGHTHAPEVARVHGAWIVNPGSPTERRRAPAHTMVVVRNGRPELLELS